MTIHGNSAQLLMTEISHEFGGDDNTWVNLADYYWNAASNYVPDSLSGTVPGTGSAINMGTFYGLTNETVVSYAVHTASDYQGGYIPATGYSPSIPTSTLSPSTFRGYTIFSIIQYTIGAVSAPIYLTLNTNTDLGQFFFSRVIIYGTNLGTYTLYPYGAVYELILSGSTIVGCRWIWDIPWSGSPPNVAIPANANITIQIVY